MVQSTSIDPKPENAQRFELPGSINKGERNEVLFKYACSLWAKGAGAEELARFVAEANGGRCNPPLSDSEVAQICSHVTTDYPQGRSRSFCARAASVPGSSAKSALEVPGFIDDCTVSELFAERYKDRLRAVYNGPKFTWYAYDGKRWQRNGTAAAQNMFRGFIDDLYWAAFNAQEISGPDATRVKQVGRCKTAAKRERLLRDSAPLMAAAPEDFDRAPNLLNLENGTIEFHPFKFRAHDPADMLTKVAGCSYNPSATFGAWRSFLEQTFKGDTADVIPFLQMSLGLALAGDTSHERFFQFKGEPRSGKSTAAMALQEVFGEYAHTSSAGTFAVNTRSAQGPSVDLMALSGSRLVIVNEWPKGKRLNSGLVKSFTGNDSIAARGLYGNDELNIRAGGLLVFISNYWPSTDDGAVFKSNRAVAVPFNNSVPETMQDHGLKSTLTAPAQLSGILNWLIAGYQICMGLGGKPPKVPESCRRATEEYKLDSDNVARFISERCEQGEGLTDGQIMWKRYESYCDSIGENRLPAKGFYTALRDNGYRVERGTVGGKQVRSAVHGLRLLE